MNTTDIFVGVYPQLFFKEIYAFLPLYFTSGFVLMLRREHVLVLQIRTTVNDFFQFEITWKILLYELDMFYTFRINHTFMGCLYLFIIGYVSS